MIEALLDRSLLARMISEAGPALEWETFLPDDWHLVVREAQAQGVAPLLHWKLARSGKIVLAPRQAQDLLRAAYTGTRLNNEQMLRELQDLASLFHRAGIPLVALKGICFALTVYPDLGLRPMGDLDLLVPAAQMPAALHIARSCDYRDVIPEALPGLDELLSHAACLKKTRMPFTVLEIHRSLVAEGSFAHAVPVDWFWTQTEPLEPAWLEGRLRHVSMLAPTAQLLYACAHAMLQHGGRGTSLRWLYDIDCLVRVHAGRLVWDLLLTQARAFEWGSSVLAALSETSALFHTPVPPAVLEELSAQGDRNTGRVAEMQSPAATHTLEEVQKLKSLDMRGRLRMLLALVVPGPAYMRWRYGLKSNWALPIWYISRWWGILMDVAKTIMHHAKNLSLKIW